MTSNPKALNLHGMIEQIPRSAHVVTTTQRASLLTPVGEYEFHQIRLPEIELPGDFSPTALGEWISKVRLEPLRLGLHDRWSRYAKGHSR